MKPSAVAFVAAEAFVAINVPLALFNGWRWTAAAYAFALFVFWKLWRAMQ